MKYHRFTAALLAASLLCSLTGCDRAQAESKAQEIIEQAETKVGEVIVDGLDKLKNAEHKGGPFENNLDSARAYLLSQLSEKYGREFIITGHEILENYGPAAGASYSCEAAPAENPDQVFKALVSQTRYKDVHDNYPIYFYKEEAEAPVLALCGEKDYVLDQKVSLDMPVTFVTWTGEDTTRFFLRNSKAYVEVALRLEDGLETETYAGQILDFIESAAEELKCDLLLQAKTEECYIYHRKLSILDGVDLASFTIESISEQIEIMKKAGAPQ